MTLPVLWICGPPGVGKSTVAWALCEELGPHVAYVDIDQLGICYPEPPDDPGRHRLQARNLAAVVDGYRAAGASAVVVSGVVDPVRGPDADLLPGADLSVVRLRADGTVLAARLERRGSADLVESALAEAAGVERTSWAAHVVDTTTAAVPAVVADIRSAVPSWPGASAPGPAPVAPTPADLDVLWLCGPTGVGKSTVGFPAYLRLLGSGARVAYLDLDQVAFCPRLPGDPGGHENRARIAAAIAAGFAAVGAWRLVVVGQVDDDALGAYDAAFAPHRRTLVRLHVRPDELTARILSRRDGGSWAQPGDPLRDRSVEHLLAVAAEAASTRLGPGHVVDTTGRSADEVAEEVAALVLG
ncbi:AAA family ATPase [Antribacter sp. KLBMP9083]|uniref:AAA family ATPase n=1 Tax=Antribacter soli TaxID=2910976 RepID=A0AA41QFH4_9MICO|nr:AAA family ATPase [Antribacter soli]MCF4122500.1 AAA family ATPase [Antribacter soli]